MITITSASLNQSLEWDDDGGGPGGKLINPEDEGGGLFGREPPGRTQEIGFIITALLVTLIMVVIVVGNMLVCIAIATEKSLKTVQNWFIASLAVSDFLIGLIIMPFSLARELMGYWIFGEIWCDIHAALDVLICTASINNLCLISLDRYWSVAHAVEYLRKRTASRALAMICFVWLLSAVISLPPLIGWRKKTEQDPNYPQCTVSEDVGYVLYSALGSFYVPAVVMVFVYIRIFLAARKRARRAMERRKTLAARTKAVIAAQSSHQLAVTTKTNSAPTSDTNSSSLTRRKDTKTKFSPPPPIVMVNTAEVEEVSPESDGSSPPISPDGDTVAGSDNHHSQPHPTNATLSLPSNVEMDSLRPVPHSESYGSVLSLNDYESDIQSTSVVPSTSVSADITNAINSASVPHSTQITATTTTTTTIASNIPVTVTTRPHRRTPTEAERNRKKIAKARERRATMILGLIMAAFILAWLPFFLFYVLGAICKSCKVGDTVFAVAFWLGYCNSAVNPIIYTIFNRDFRRAFRKILFK